MIPNVLAQGKQEHKNQMNCCATRQHPEREKSLEGKGKTEKENNKDIRPSQDKSDDSRNYAVSRREASREPCHTIDHALPSLRQQRMASLSNTADAESRGDRDASIRVRDVESEQTCGRSTTPCFSDASS